MKTKKKLPQVQYNKPVYNIQLTEDEMYNFGGWLKENAGSLLSTAAGAVMTATGVGAAAGIPMMVSGASGLLGSAFADRTDEDLERRNAEAEYQTQMNMPKTVGTKNMTPNVMHFKKGGKIEKVMSEFKHGKLHSGSKKGPKVKSRKQAIAIAISEAKKAGQYEDGGLMEIQGPSHEQGGVQLQQGVEVEGGENIENNVVNSDSWMITQDIADNYGLPKQAVGKTAADYRRSVEKRYKGREGDPFAMKSKEIEGNNISQMSKEIADIMGANKQKMQLGGEKYDPNKVTLRKILPDSSDVNQFKQLFGPAHNLGNIPMDFASDYYNVGNMMLNNDWAYDDMGNIIKLKSKTGLTYDDNISPNSNPNNIPILPNKSTSILTPEQINNQSNNNTLQDQLKKQRLSDLGRPGITKISGKGTNKGTTYSSSFNPVESFMEGERNWVTNMGNNLAQKPLTTQPVTNKSVVVPRVSTLNAGTEPLAKMGVSGLVGKTRIKY